MIFYDRIPFCLPIITGEKASERAFSPNIFLKEQYFMTRACQKSHYDSLWATHSLAASELYAWR